jgi:hypothetical protein
MGMRKIVVAGLLLTGLVGVSMAGPGGQGGNGGQQGWGGQGGNGGWQGWGGSGPNPQSAPEISVSSAGAALALLAGSLIVLRGRRTARQG